MPWICPFQLLCHSLAVSLWLNSTTNATELLKCQNCVSDLWQLPPSLEYNILYKARQLVPQSFIEIDQDEDPNRSCLSFLGEWFRETLAMCLPAYWVQLPGTNPRTCLNVHCQSVWTKGQFPILQQDQTRPSRSLFLRGWGTGFLPLVIRETSFMRFRLLIWLILKSGEGKKTVGDIFDIYRLNFILSIMTWNI